MDDYNRKQAEKQRKEQDKAEREISTPDATHGYKSFTLGAFSFRRDEYFAHINWKTRDGRPLSHTMDVGGFLRALMRDVAWGFFYGGVNFDHVFGTTNHYKTVDMYAGTFNATMKAADVDLLENFPTEQIASTFAAMLDEINAHYKVSLKVENVTLPPGPAPTTSRGRSAARCCASARRTT